MASTSASPPPRHIAAPHASEPTAPSTTNDTTTQPQDRKRKRNATTTHTIHTSTLRQRTWSYLHLRLVTPSLLTTPPTTPAHPATDPHEPSLDAPTIHTLLSPPLAAYLGTTGLSIPLDILRARARDAWVRVPARDARGVKAALAGWVGSVDADAVPGVEGGGRVRVAWRVVGDGGTLGLCVDGDGGVGVFE